VAVAASAQPNYRVGPLLFAISNRGVVRISGEGFNLGTGSLMSWGPGWQWVDSCSWQDSWSLVSGPTGSEVEYEVECYAKCAFAEFRPKVKYWVGANATLLEVNLTVVSDSSFAGMAWTLQIPIERFARGFPRAFSARPNPSVTAPAGPRGRNPSSPESGLFLPVSFSPLGAPGARTAAGRHR